MQRPRIKRLVLSAYVLLFAVVNLSPVMVHADALPASPTTTGASGRTPFTGTPPPAAVAPQMSQMSALQSNNESSSTNTVAATLKADTSKHANCPPGTNCKVVTAGLVDGGCNWSQADRPQDLPIYGINEHTTEGTLQAALDEAQDTSNCVSWNYLIGQDGTIYSSVPVDSLSYDAANWWVNTHYVEVEHVGFAEDCSTLTPAEYNASVKLDRWLISKYHIQASSATITGHDSVMGTNDASTTTQHWDPGVCWPWAKYLSDVGAPIVPTASPRSSVVTIRTDNSKQPIQDCPGASFTDCKSAAQDTTNFMALYTAPSTSSPLISDPYLHPDASVGSTAMEDWGDKAPTGHDYVVIARKPGWIEIWYGGQAVWMQNNQNVTVPTSAMVVTPKNGKTVPIYGRPMPEYDAPGWSAIPYDHQSQVALTKYNMQPGQQYAVADVPQPRDDYAEGCNVADCTGPGDTTVVIGKTKYIEISWNHRWAFVQASDVNVRPASD